MFNALGVDTHLFVRFDGPLRTFDSMLRDTLMKEMAASGVCEGLCWVLFGSCLGMIGQAASLPPPPPPPKKCIDIDTQYFTEYAHAHAQHRAAAPPAQHSHGGDQG